MSLVQVVDHLVEETRKRVDPSLTSDEFFELFVSELVTRDYGLDWDDIDSGIVDGGNDGQIDAIYVLVDDALIREQKEFDLKSARRNANIRVVIHQSKNSPSFPENSFSKMRASISDLFDLEKKIPQLKKVYNSDVIGQVEIFRDIWPAPGSEDTELGVFMGPEVRHGAAEVYERVQA